jgi:hypothetical protein
MLKFAVPVAGMLLAATMFAAPAAAEPFDFKSKAPGASQRSSEPDTIQAAADGSYFEFKVNTDCVGSNCDVTFPKVPNGKRLIVRVASCYVRLEAASEIEGLGLNVGGDNPLVFLDPVLNSGARNTFSATEQILFPVAARARPKVLVKSAGAEVGALACSLAGDLVNE